MAVGVAREHAGRKIRNTPLGLLFTAFRQEGDPAAGEALAALLARFMRHLELHMEFDLACKLPADYISGDGDATGALFGWPGVDYPLSVREELFLWGVAAGLGAVGTECAMTLQRAVNGRRVLILTDYYRLDPTCSAVHLLHAGGAAKVGVLALCADSGDLCGL